MGPKAKKASYVRSTIKQNLWREDINDFDEFQDANEGLTRLDEPFATEADMQVMQTKTEEYGSKFNDNKKDCISYYLRVLNHGKKHPTHISPTQNSREVRKSYMKFQGNTLLSFLPNEIISLENTTKKRKRLNNNTIANSSSSSNTNNNNNNSTNSNNNDKAQAELDAQLEKALEIENSREGVEFDDDSVGAGMGDEEEEDEGDYQQDYYYHDSDDDDKLEEDAEATF